MNVKRPLLIVGIALVVLTLGVPAPGSAELPPGTTEVSGDWKGALYALYVPADWNGDLILYAHGFVARQDPIVLPDPEIPGPYPSQAELRDALLGQGYAIALSSYSTTGWAVEEGFFETRHLLPLFTSYFGRPDRLYVMGHSMGGLITLRLTEKHPGLIDGALPMCGAIGGTGLAVEHVQHVRALFDYFYPGALPGNALYVPDPYTALDVYFAALFAMLGDTRPVPGWYELGQIHGLALPSDPNQLFESILARIWFQAGLDLMERTGGKSFWGNADTRYAGSFDDGMLNSLVDRYEATPSGQAYLRRWYRPTGKLRTPTLTLHNAIDGLVPFSHEVDYAHSVATQGYSPNLVQRTVDRFGHCAFTAEEQVEAFADLVTWVETGVKPTP